VTAQVAAYAIRFARGEITLNEEVPRFTEHELAQARLGNPQALTALVRAHQRSVYSLALRMLGLKELAEDLAQEVFVQLNSSLPSIESCAHLTFWLRKVTAFRAIDQLRRRTRFPTVSLDEEVHLYSDADVGDPLLHRHLKRLLEELSPPARAVLLLRYQEDLDPTEIARTLEMPINTVKSHLQRSLQLMRQKTPGALVARSEDESK
jgi:RNA polymerase sigma-70 factor (ECF subfamily)